MELFCSTFKIIAAVVGLSLVGCADFARQFAMSDGLIDFMMDLSGHEQIDAYPVKRICRDGGEIISAHARKDSRGVFVFGYVGNRYGANSVTTAWSHIDIVILDSEGRQLQSIATIFFPSTVPETHRGIRGRSSYFVRLSSMPPAGSTIIVEFDPVPIFHRYSGYYGAVLNDQHGDGAVSQQLDELSSESKPTSLISSAIAWPAPCGLRPDRAKVFDYIYGVETKGDAAASDTSGELG